MSVIEVASELDLRGVACPDNYVRTILALEELEPGQVLKVTLDGKEAISDVPRSVKHNGHQILSAECPGDGLLVIYIKKAG